MESFSPEAAAGLAKFGVRLLRKEGEEAGCSETASSVCQIRCTQDRDR